MEIDFNDFFEDDALREELNALPEIEIIDLVEKIAEMHRVNLVINAPEKEYSDDVVLTTAISRSIVQSSDTNFSQQILLHFNSEQKTPIATACSFIVVKGRPKVGKTTALVWIAAALFGCPDLPYVGAMPSTDHLLWIDTEQSRIHIGLIRDRIAHLMPSDINWTTRLTLLSLRSYSPQARLRLIEHFVESNSNTRVLVIDNVADLVLSILDDAEAGELMRRLFRLIESRRLLIIAVLHTNKSNSHSRGHLGSLADQRAESLLNIERHGDVMSVDGELTRNAPVPQVTYMIKDGKFQFLDNAGELETKPTKSQFDKTPIEVHKMVLADIFCDQRELKPGDFQKRLKDAYANRVSKIGIELRKQLQKFYLDQNLIIKQDGKLRRIE